MSNRIISGSLFKKMVTNGAVNLKNNHKEIDHLNVFPVPDGDTGTNMQMTMMAGIKEVNNVDSQSIVDVSKILSRGLLMGARGNSGVILSQFFRGIYSEIAKIENGFATVKEFIHALVGGYQMAYRAVMDPVEGTILTVVRESAEKVLREESHFDSVEDVLKSYLEQAKVTLTKTPELLPVLKEAGVVDSGGAGFIKIVEGMVMALEGNMLDESEVSGPVFSQKVDNAYGAHMLGDVDIKFGYCTEFIVKLFNFETFKEKQVSEPLSQIGDSLVVVSDDDLLKVHVHTNKPGVALTIAQKFGELQTIKVENMRIQHSEIMDNTTPKEVKTGPKAKYGIIAVASGSGIKEVFKELGADIVIDGGQTMNPPTEEFVNAVNNLYAERVIILPNNSNIILTAEQVIDLCPDTEIRVLRSKNIAQGYASLMGFDSDLDIDTNAEEMTRMISNVTAGEVTYSVRDTEINGLKIKSGDFIGITKNEIKVSTKSSLTAAKKLLDLMVTEDKEILTIFYGIDVSETEINKFVSYVKDKHPQLEVETILGKQEIYYYILAVE